MKNRLNIMENTGRYTKWSLLTVVIIAIFLAGCGKVTVLTTTNSVTDKANWTTFTDANTVAAVLVKGSDLWAATAGGAVKWNMNTGTYQKFTTSDGLIDNNIGGMAQDKSGNLWFVTGSVTRYDGKSWQNLCPTGVSEDTGISCIAIDIKNNIYLGASDCSVYLYSGTYQQIKSPDEPPDSRLPAFRGIGALAVDRENNLWSIGSDGIQRYDGKSWVKSADIPGFPEGTVGFIGADKNGDLWFQNDSDYPSCYLYCYDGTLWQKIGVQLTGSYVQSITVDKQGNLWCATLGTLQRYNGTTWQTFNCPVAGIDSIAADDNGNIWCGAFQHGLLRFDGNSWKTYLTDDISEINDMVFMDRDNEGNIWFDTGKGLSRFDGKNWEMVNQDVTNATCFLQDKRGDLWFGAWNHVYRYDGTSWDIFSPDSQTTVTSIVEDHTGNVWISTMNYLYDFDGKSWTTYDVRDYLKITQNNVMINSVTIDSQNTVWAATTNGIVHFDRTNWQIYTTADGLDDDYINAIYQDKSGKIWAYGFYSGLNLFDDSSWQLFLKDDRIVDIAQDDKGNMWLATDHGVTKYDGDTFENYTTADGLPDNSIRKIIMVNGNVWGGTNTGVSYYNGKSWQSITNGLAGIGVYQIVADRSGGIWFGMWGGISRYAPAQGNPSPIHIETKAPASVFADQLIDIAVTPAPVYTLVAGQSCQFIAMGTFFDNMGENITARVTWSSFDTAVAKISVGGLAAGEKAGSTVITASMSAITSPAVTLVVVTPVAAATTP